MTHPDLASDFAPLRTLDARPNNLPLQVTAFFGREGELAEAQRLLEKTRLLTLAGTGGVGKTRLALQLAANVAEDFADGVWFVDLSSLRDGAVVATVVAAAMGIREESGTAVAQTLVRSFKEKRALLLLDNCEQIIDECAKLADALQRGCPNLHIVATSREVLNVSGEVIYRLPAIGARDAIEFFSARAEMVVPAFRLNEENAEAVAEICGRLDGLPMAIELAAARVKTMSVTQLAKHLDDRFRVLTGGSRTASPRQQTLSNLIGWSYDLLAESERAMLRRHAVFAADFDLETASTIVVGAPVEEWECLDILSKLVDKSLITTESSGADVRYRFLESTREYAQQRLLEAAKSDVFFRRHAQYWRERASEAHASQLTPRGADDRARLSREYANVRAVLAWAITERNDLSLGSALAANLRSFWYLGGMFHEGYYWFQALLDRAQATEVAIRGAALMGIATMHNMGRCARDPLRQALRIFEELGDDENAKTTRSILAGALINAGDFDGALALLEIALADQLRQVGAYSPTTLYNVALLHWNLRMDEAKAQEFALAALGLARSTGSPYLTFVLNILGRIATHRGDYADALGKLTEAVDLGRSLAMSTHIALNLVYRAYLFVSRGDLVAASGDFLAALDLVEQDGMTSLAAMCFDASVVVASAFRRWDGVGKLVGVSNAFQAKEELFRALPEQQSFDAAESAARAALGDDAFEDLCAQGAALDLDAAFKLARASISAPTTT